MPVEFAYMRGAFVPDGASRFQQRLRNLGAIQSMVLVSKAEVGDDRIFLHEVAFGSRTMHYTVAFAPDGKVSQCQLVQQ